MLQKCFWSTGSLTKSILCFVLAAAHGASALTCEPNRKARCPAIACKPRTAQGSQGAGRGAAAVGAGYVRWRLPSVKNIALALPPALGPHTIYLLAILELTGLSPAVNGPVRGHLLPLLHQVPFVNLLRHEALFCRRESHH